MAFHTRAQIVAHEGHRIKTTGNGTRYCHTCQEWLLKVAKEGRT